MQLARADMSLIEASDARAPPESRARARRDGWLERFRVAGVARFGKASTLPLFVAR